MPKPNRAAIKGGFKFEEDFAEKIKAKLQPGSGNKFYARLDVDGNTVLWSLKSTTKRTLTITPELLAEASAAAQGPGASDVTPGIAIRIADMDDDLVLLKLDDFLAIIRGEVKIQAGEPSKAENRKNLSNLPTLMRRKSSNEA